MHVKNKLHEVIIIVLLFGIIQGCDKLELKRVMDTKTNKVEVQGTNVFAHGTVLDVGASSIVSYGHCWSIEPEPSVEASNYYTDLGSKSETGDYTSSLFGVAPGLIHYVRSYVFDGTSYVYGEELSFEITAENLEFSSSELDIIEIGTVIVSSSTNGLGSVNFANHGHCWSKADPPTINDNKSSFGPYNSDATFSSQINNLNMGMYYVRGYLETEGTVIYTTSVAYEPVISTETGLVNLNDDNSAIAFGTINSISARGVLDHGHCWSTLTSAPTLNNEHSSLGGIDDLGNFSSNIENLIAGRKYYIRSYATDGDRVYYGRIREFDSHQEN